MRYDVCVCVTPSAPPGFALKGWPFVAALKDTGLARGYRDSGIDDYLENKQNKTATRVRCTAYYAKHGTSNLDANSLCILGSAEAKQHNRIGRLLKAK
jgi:hypothetical protein